MGFWQELFTAMKNGEERIRWMLYVSLGINLIYALLQTYLGIVNQFGWYLVMAIYYLLLGGMRFSLSKQMGKGNLEEEKRICRRVGAVLLVMGLVLPGMIVGFMMKNEMLKHGTIMAITMATYTFYYFAGAVISYRKYRKHKSPVIKSSRLITITAAIVSMMSLEIAMLATFRSGEVEDFEMRLIGVSGVVAWVAIMVIAIYMMREFRTEKRAN